MLSVYKIKPYFQKLLMPILHKLHSFGISANQITIASVFLSILIALGFWFANDLHILFLILPIGLLLRMALNALDGMMARLYNQISKKGELLNEVGDVFSDFIIFLPLVKYQSDNLLLIVLFIGMSIINEFTGLIGKVVSDQRTYDGPMGKSDRAFWISIIAVIIVIFPYLSEQIIYLTNIVHILISLMCLLLAFTIYNRIRRSL